MDTLDKLKSERDLYRQERDLYRRLLEIARQTELEPLLRHALALIVDITGARHGYIEVHDEGEGSDHAPRWCIAHGFSASEVEELRARISRGIVAMAIASGQTIMTASARLDPRFNDRESVTQARIDEVLCAPIGGDATRGVLYLQGRDTPAPFTDDDRERVEFVARHLGAFTDRLRHEAALEPEDPVTVLRSVLRMDGVIGRSPALAALLQQAALLAPLDVNVLLTGESGTGKSQLARVIHESGPRARHPFVELNCGSLPDTLLESELFGALPGAHSTATRRIEGKVTAAERGTLFLDEIAELSPTGQTKLLQLLQSKEYYPLGASKPIRADIRIMAATNSNLQQAVEQHRFREDLFYRLQVLPLRVPSLAERREDVRPLMEHFCTTVGQRHRLGVFTVSPGAIRAAESMEWPGNVRQLEHAVEAAVIRAAGEAVRQIERRHLFPDGTPAGVSPAAALTFQEATRQFQASLLREKLEETSWNVPEAARRLDLAKSHAYNLIRVFGLGRDRS